MSDSKSKNSKDKNRESAPLSDPEMQRVHAQLMREKEEPREGFPPVPIFLLFLFAIVVFICGIYMGERSGGFRWDIYDPNFDPALLSVERAATAFDPIARGQRVYSQQCAQCHQSSGAGVPGVYPPLVGTSWVLETRAVPIAILLNGLSGDIEVLGNTYNGLMPDFKRLSDRDIAAVLTYIRQEWGNDAGPISEEQVAEMRDRVGGRASHWSAAELLELSPLATQIEEPGEETPEEAIEAEQGDIGAGEEEVSEDVDSRIEGPEEESSAVAPRTEP